VRVGLEDSLYAGKHQLAKSNAEQVAKIRRILEELSLEIATPAEARAMLGRKAGTTLTSRRVGRSLRSGASCHRGESWATLSSAAERPEHAWAIAAASCVVETVRMPPGPIRTPSFAQAS